MGYETEFFGKFTLDRPLTEAQKRYLVRFSETRRMKRDNAKLQNLPDPIREAVGLPLGPDGAYFVGSTERWGDEDDPSIVFTNKPPEGQPSLWCEWIPSSDGKHIEWNEQERFYAYIEWLEYLIGHFLSPWSHKLSGEVSWVGEEEFDTGLIRVNDNAINIVGPALVRDSSESCRSLNVFLCHYSGDKVAVRALHQKLIEHYIEVWFDEVNILPGQDWALEIRRAIRNADAVLVCLSSSSVGRIGYVQKEIKYALDIADEQPEGSIFIIPARLDNCEVPERLRQWQWVDLYEETGFARLLSALVDRAETLSVGAGNLPTEQTGKV